MKEVGGPAYLAQLTGSGAAVIGARDFAGQIYDLALLRALIGVGRELVEGALDTSEDVAPLAQIERAETELYKVAEEGGAEGKAKSFAEATKEALELAEKALNSGGHLSGFTTGLDSLNAKIGGLHKSDLIIVAGRPGMGKSALGTNMAFAAARALPAATRRTGSSRPSRPARRSPCSASKCRPTSWRRVSLPSSRGSAPRICARARSASRSSATLARAAAELQSLPLYIDDTPGLTIAALRARARRLKRQKGIGMVVVDYLQLLQGSGKNGNDNRVQEISEISRGLKQLAKELDVPVIALVAAQPRGRAARGQAAAAVGPARIRLDRAGRRHRALHLPRGLLSRSASSRRRPSRRDRQARQVEEMERDAYGRQGRSHRRQAAPRLDRQGPRSGSTAGSPSSATLVDEGYMPEMRGG